MMETVLQDLRYGLRVLYRSPAFSAVAILSLALGIGANTAIFTVVNAVFLRPLPVAEPERLMAVYGTDEKNTGNAANFLPISYPNYVDYRDQNDVFAGLVVFGGAGLNVSEGGEPEQLNGLIVSGNYFDVLGVKAARGRTFLPEEDGAPGMHPVAVISSALWQRRFGGDPSVVGRTVSLNNQSFTVIGIAPEGFRGTFALGNVDVWVPMAMHEQVLTGNVRKFFKERRALIFNVLGRLKPGVAPEQAQAAMQTIGRRLEQEYPRENERRNVTLRPLAESAIDPNQRDLFVRAGALLLTVVGLVLLIACANVANLLLARATARRKEMAIRTALGAGRSRLIRQLLTESLMLAALGGAVGILFAYWGRGLLWSFRPPFLNQDAVELSFDPTVLGYTALLSILTGVIFGLVPALQTARTDLVTDLKERTSQGGQTRQRVHLRQLLVVGQVALSLVSLIGAGLFLRSLYNARQLDPGFETGNLLVMSFDVGSQGYSEPRGQEFYRQVQERVKGLAGVRSASVASNRPLTPGFMRSVIVEGQESPPGGRGTLTLTNVVGLGYFETLGVPLLRGRDFGETDREQTVKVAVINEAAARRFWPEGEPVGKRFKFFGEESSLEVAGVVKNIDSVNLGEAPRPVIYLPLSQNFTPNATLHVRTSGDPEAMIGTIRREVQSLDTNLPVLAPLTVSEMINRATWAPRMGAVLLSVFGLLALALTAIGIYGVLAYLVNQRTHEIGLRMALGARRRDILRLIIRQGLILVAAGAAIGLAVGFAATRLVTHLLYGVPGGDPLVFLSTILLLTAVTLLATYIPARRATRINPMVALRNE